MSYWFCKKYIFISFYFRTTSKFEIIQFCYEVSKLRFIKSSVIKTKMANTITVERIMKFSFIIIFLISSSILSCILY